MKAKLIPCDGGIETIEIKTFEHAREFVCKQGYDSPLEIITLYNNKAFLIDMEGKLKNLPINLEATTLAHEEEVIYPSDYICGDAIFIEDLDEFDELPYQ